MIKINNSEPKFIYVSIIKLKQQTRDHNSKYAGGTNGKSIEERQQGLNG